jgi:hypothetical protein
MVAAYVLVFIAQFFEFGSTYDSYQTRGGGFVLTHPVDIAQNGWFYHSWISGVVMGVVAFIFFVSSPKVLWYWVAGVLCLLLSLGSGFGATLGLIATAIAGYAIHTKRKENKVVVKEN